MREILHKLYADIVESCKKCDGSGRVVVRPFQKGHAEVKDYCSCARKYMEERDYLYRMNASNIPQFYKKRALLAENPFFNQYSISGTFSNSKRGLVINGKYRSGKTTLSCDILKQAARNGTDVKFWDFTTLSERMWEEELKERDYSTIKECLKVDLLVLDDILSSERDHDYAERKLAMIVNTRYTEELCTIFTSNATKEELSEKMSDRTFHRLNEYCDFVKI